MEQKHVASSNDISTNTASNTARKTHDTNIDISKPKW